MGTPTKEELLKAQGRGQQPITINVNSAPMQGPVTDPSQDVSSADDDDASYQAFSPPPPKAPGPEYQVLPPAPSKMPASVRKRYEPAAPPPVQQASAPPDQAPVPQAGQEGPIPGSLQPGIGIPTDTLDKAVGGLPPEAPFSAQDIIARSQGVATLGQTPAPPPVPVEPIDPRSPIEQRVDQILGEGNQRTLAQAELTPPSTDDLEYQQGFELDASAAESRKALAMQQALEEDLDKESKPFTQAQAMEALAIQQQREERLAHWDDVRRREWDRMTAAQREADAYYPDPNTLLGRPGSWGRALTMAIAGSNGTMGVPALSGLLNQQLKLEQEGQKAGYDRRAQRATDAQNNIKVAGEMQTAEDQIAITRLNASKERLAIQVDQLAAQSSDMSIKAKYLDLSAKLRKEIAESKGKLATQIANSDLRTAQMKMAGMHYDTKLHRWVGMDGATGGAGGSGGGSGPGHKPAKMDLSHGWWVPDGKGGRRFEALPDGIKLGPEESKGLRLANTYRDTARKASRRLREMTAEGNTAHSIGGAVWDKWRSAHDREFARNVKDLVIARTKQLDPTSIVSENEINSRIADMPSLSGIADSRGDSILQELDTIDAEIDDNYEASTAGLVPDALGTFGDTGGNGKAVKPEGMGDLPGSPVQRQSVTETDEAGDPVEELATDKHGKVINRYFDVDPKGDYVNLGTAQEQIDKVKADKARRMKDGVWFPSNDGTHPGALPDLTFARNNTRLAQKAVKKQLDGEVAKAKKLKGAAALVNKKHQSQLRGILKSYLETDQFITKEIEDYKAGISEEAQQNRTDKANTEIKTETNTYSGKMRD